jgi:hypothetical protein
MSRKTLRYGDIAALLLGLGPLAGCDNGGTAPPPAADPKLTMHKGPASSIMPKVAAGKVRPGMKGPGPAAPGGTGGGATPPAR